MAYLVVCEAVTNALKHADADTIRTRLLKRSLAADAAITALNGLLPWWPGELVGDLDMLDCLGRDGGGDRQRRAGRGQVGRCLGGDAGADAVLQAIGLRRGI
ncbi:hypothetical protein ACFWY5_23940 [Nonomuraea sp. NPDC059007]|uniref:hypothetical protein n=1 Tax=Nonomuraea sp. NPDC059007 TaxID=3346692 RepID=UPI0036AF73AD